MIRFTVRITALLLGLSAALVVVGLFDAFLGWDIFSKSVEAVLYGVFFSCITLATAGIALTFVLGVLEIVDLLRASAESRPPPAERGTASLRRAASLALVGMALLLVALGLVNRQVQRHRSDVFKELAEAQAERFEPKVTPHLPAPAPVPESNARLDQAMATLQHLDLFRSVDLYVADPDDPDALWVYQCGWRETPSRFERRYAAKTHETAVAAALRGDGAALERLNRSRGLRWLYALERPDGAVAAVLQLDGNENENLRAYSK